VDHPPSQKKRNHIQVVSVTLSPRGIKNTRSSAVLKIHFALLVDFAYPSNDSMRKYSGSGHRNYRSPVTSESDAVRRLSFIDFISRNDVIYSRCWPKTSSEENCTFLKAGSVPFFLVLFCPSNNYHYMCSSQKRRANRIFPGGLVCGYLEQATPESPLQPSFHHLPTATDMAWVHCESCYRFWS
jgi:hypothetical protein